MSINLSLNQEIQQFANLELLAKQVVEGFITGLHQSPFHGFSVEFAEHRAYNNGESVRNVDWKLMARTDKLFVKQFEEETNLRCFLVLDTSSSMNFPEKGLSKLEFGVYSAAALMYLFKKQRDAFGLCLFSDQVDFISPAKSTSAHLFYLFAQLEKILQDKRSMQATTISQVLHQLAGQIHKRSLIIIFSDMLENAMDEQKSADLFAAMQHLKHSKHEVVIFNISDHQKELGFNFENRPYHFVDLESGAEMKVHPNEIREGYQSALNAYRHNLELKCAQYHIDLVDANLHDGYDQVLKAYLIKRNKMA
jgi:uncharacterized protein (DUF58 family)